MKDIFTFAVIFYLLKSVVSKEKIAIIGAGIGGTSCSYFLRELFADNVEIDIYEKGTIGGRLATIKYNSEEYETGGSVIHVRNKYMASLVNKFGLKRREVDSSSHQLAIVNGNTTDIVTSKWNIITMLNLLWKYGFSWFSLNKFVYYMLNSFDRIYELQSEMVAFETVFELLFNMNPEFVSYLKISTAEGFKKYGKMTDRIIFDLVQASLRVNYGQTVDVQTFVGAVSVAGISDSLWSVEGGNKLVAEKCLQHSKANFYNYKVNKIIKNADNDKFIIQTDNGDNRSNKQYDAVVVAAPITDDTRGDVKFVNFTHKIKVPGRYQRTVATILKGRLNKLRFGRDIDNVGCLINLDTNDIFNSLGIIKPVNDTNVLETAMWKIFSQRVLTDVEINDLFEEPKIIQVVDWSAYPHYELKRNYRKDSFILSNKLYYINAIEWSASAMEMSVLSAKNVALLLFKRLTSVPESTSTSAHRVELR